MCVYRLKIMFPYVCIFVLFSVLKLIHSFGKYLSLAGHWVLGEAVVKSGEGTDVLFPLGDFTVLKGI